MDSVLDVLPKGDTPDVDDEAATRCAAIDAARAGKDFATADRIRAELIDAGYDVSTTKDGTKATKKLA